MNEKLYLFAILISSVLLLVAYRYAPITEAEIYVKPQYVIDGDTFASTDGERIRLWGIDAPELKSKGGNASKAYLKTLVVSQKLTCRHKHIDRYGRKIMQCFNRDGDIADQLVQASMAVDYPFYSDEYYAPTPP